MPNSTEDIQHVARVVMHTVADVVDFATTIPLNTYIIVGVIVAIIVLRDTWVVLIPVKILVLPIALWIDIRERNNIDKEFACVTCGAQPGDHKMMSHRYVKTGY